LLDFSTLNRNSQPEIQMHAAKHIIPADAPPNFHNEEI